MSAPGRLILVPTPLDFGVDEADPPDVQQTLPLGSLQAAARLNHWVAENAKTLRAFLKRVNAVQPLAQPLQGLDIRELPRPPKGHAPLPPPFDDTLLAPALAGHDLGLASEAGLPAVADPGAALVERAHARGLQVLPLSGPSSLLLALAASGLNGQSFAFVGYLPVEAGARAARLRELEATSRRQRQTQLMIETPYRNPALMDALLSILGPSTHVSVACGLTLPDGWVRTDTVAGWKARAARLPDRVPAVFSLLAT